jgi:hypothetical protein
MPSTSRNGSRPRLDEVEHLLPEGFDHLPGIDWTNAADHSGGQILLDALEGTRSGGAHEARLELPTMRGR